MFVSPLSLGAVEGRGTLLVPEKRPTFFTSGAYSDLFGSAQIYTAPPVFRGRGWGPLLGCTVSPVETLSVGSWFGREERWKPTGN